MKKLVRIKSGILVTIIFTLSINLHSQIFSKTNDVYPEKREVLDYLNQADIVEKFGKISDAIWSYAELGLQEFKSVELLSRILEEEGFSIEMGLAGMPTCFVAEYGTGKPVIGVLMEFDALPMMSQKGRIPYQSPLIEGAPGHACGHNMMAAASVASAIAVKRSIELYNIQGTIKVFGSPAEEMLISRPYMIREGLFKDVDVVIDNHSGPYFQTSYGTGGSAAYSVIFSFKGESAHSSVVPWNGRSALDAVEIMNVATNFLREHLHYSTRLSYIIKDGGQAPNVVPDMASVHYVIKDNDERLLNTYERVVNCAKAAALATGSELFKIQFVSAVHQQYSNKALAELLQRNIELIGMPEWSEEENKFAQEIQRKLGVKETGMPKQVSSLKAPPDIFIGGGSSDVGDVSLVCPTATLRFPGSIPGVIGHHWSRVSASYGSAAWKGLIAGAKVISASIMDILTQTQNLNNIRSEFEELTKLKPYESFLPEDATLPLDINSELMNIWRPVMEKYYLNE